MPRGGRNVAPSRPTKKMVGNTAAVILAAGPIKSTNFRGAVSLLPTKTGEMLLERQVGVLRSLLPALEIVLVLGFEADIVVRSMPAGIRIVENESYAKSNTSRSLCMGLRATDAENVLIVHGDVLFNEIAAAPLFLGGSSIIVNSKNHFDAEEIGVIAVDGQATQFSFGHQTRWGQMAMLTGIELSLLREIVANRAFDMSCTYEVLNEVLEGGGMLATREREGSVFVEVDSVRGMERLART